MKSRKNKLLPIALGAAICLHLGAFSETGPESSRAPLESGPAAARLDMAAAVGLAMANHPRLRAGAAAGRAAAGRTAQAGALPNPEVELESEDVGLDGGNRFGASVQTLRLSQAFELGGKRRKRQAAAAFEAALAAADLNASRAALAAAVRAGFVGLQAAQERLKTAEAAHALAGQVCAAVGERVHAGKSAAVALHKAELAVAERQMELRRAAHAVAAAKAQLAPLLGLSAAEAAALQAAGGLGELPELPGLERFRQRLTASPEWLRGDATVGRAQAQVALERSAAMPDVTLSAGVSRGRPDGWESMEFGISMPLPIFDRNRGNVSAALAEAEQAQAELEASRGELRAELESLWLEAQAAREEAAALAGVLLPGARRAFANTEEAYRAGKLEYLDMLDAQQALFDLELRFVAVLEEAHLGQIEITRLVGDDPMAKD